MGLFGTEKSLTFQRSSCGKDFLSVLALLLSLFTALLLLTSQLTGFALYTSAAKKECLTACIIGKRLKNSLRRPEIFLAGGNGIFPKQS